MTRSKLKKSVSLFLVIVMLFSLLPFTEFSNIFSNSEVYADSNYESMANLFGDGTSNTYPSGTGPAKKGDITDLTSRGVYKISVMFCERDGLKVSEKEDGTKELVPIFNWDNPDKVYQIGRTVFAGQWVLRKSDGTKVYPNVYNLENYYYQSTVGHTFSDGKITTSFDDVDISNPNDPLYFTTWETGNGFWTPLSDAWDRMLSNISTVKQYLPASKDTTEGQILLRDYVNRLYDMQLKKVTATDTSVVNRTEPV
jgi:hypothetical protein